MRKLNLDQKEKENTGQKADVTQNRQEYIKENIENNTEIKRRVNRSGTVERVLRLRNKGGLDTIKENEEENKKEISNNIVIGDEPDKIKFLSSKNKEEVTKKNSKVVSFQEPININIKSDLFKKKEIKDDAVSDNSGSSEEEEKESEEPKKEEEEEIKKKAGELGPGEFTSEELKKDDDSTEQTEDLKIKITSPEPKEGPKINKDTPIKSPGEWGNFPAIKTTTSEGFGDFGDVFNQNFNSQLSEDDGTTQNDVFSSGNIWGNYENEENTQEEKTPDKPTAEQNVNPNIADFSKKKEDETIKSKNNNDNQNNTNLKPKDDTDLSRRAFKKQNRSIVVESEKMSSNSLSKSRRSESQKVIPSFIKSSKKYGEAENKSKNEDIIRANELVINEVLAESENQESLDKGNNSIIEEKIIEKDLLTGDENNNEDDIEVNDPSELLSPSKEIDLSGQIFDLNAFADVSQTINESKIEENNQAEENENIVDKFAFLNFEKDKEEIGNHKSLLVVPEINKPIIDPFITAQSIIEDEDEQRKETESHCLKIDLSDGNIILDKLSPRGEEEKKINLKVEESEIELEKLNESEREDKEEKTEEGQENIARDPTPIEKNKEFSFDSKENPIKRLTPNKKKLEPKDTKEADIKGGDEEKEDDPFSAFDFITTEEKNNGEEDNQNGFDFPFINKEEEDSGIWNKNQDINNVFKTEKEEKSMEINELDSLINESLNSSKMEMKLLEEEVQESAPDEDDPFNTFKNVFL